MKLKTRQIAMLLVTMQALLVLFAGCSGKSEEADVKNPSVQIVAETVSSTTTTNRITTSGSPALHFEAEITSQEGGSEWCSFNLNKQVSTTGGRVGEPIYLYLKTNSTDVARQATIVVTYTNGYSATLNFTQQGADFVDYDRAWGEQPTYKPNDAYIYKTYFATFVRNQFFAGGKLRNFSVCYDVKRHVSHWVAYPIYKKIYETPYLDRKDSFGYDPNDQAPEIPRDEQQYINRGYGVRGYDRGHILPQASRMNNYDANQMTFYATNMMPQNSSLNQHVWASLEGKVRGWGGLQKYDTLYVVTGTAFKDSKTIPNANGPIAVPTHCWKVLLRQRGNLNKPVSALRADELKAIGFLFTNDSRGAATSIQEAACSVQKIEELTGFTFFRNLDPSVADQVKSRYNLSEWN